MNNMNVIFPQSFVTLLLFFMFTEVVYSQDIAVKSNILYDATGSMNLGLEVALSNKLTLDISGNYNPWTLDKLINSKAKHFLIQPELRFWGCEAFQSHFFGFHTHYAYYNIGGSNWLTKVSESISGHTMTPYRYEGWLVGAGFSYGYHLILDKRWALEGTIGFGYAYMDYDKYDCENCGTLQASSSKHYFGPTKIGLSLIFMIKQNRFTCYY